MSSPLSPRDGHDNAELFAFPLPCRIDNLLQRRVLGIPAQLMHDAFRTGAEHRRITFTSGAYPQGDDTACDFSRRIADLSDRVALPQPDIVSPHTCLVQILQSTNLCA